MSNLKTDPANAVWLLNELSSTDEIDGNEIDVRFELEDGRDSGCDVKIQDIADLAIKYITILEDRLNPRREVITDPVEISRLMFEDEAPAKKPEIEALCEATLLADYHKWSV